MGDRRAYLNNEIRIAVVGKTGVGKSATANTIAGWKAFESTAALQSVTGKCQEVITERFGRQLQVVDVPGFLDTAKSKEELHSKIAQSIVMLSPGIHAILFVIRIGRYTEEDVTTVKEFIQVFGEGSKDYVIVVFTGADDLVADGIDLRSLLEKSRVTLKTFIKEVNDRYISVNNRANKTTKDEFVQELLGLIDQMVHDNSRSYYTCPIIRDSETVLFKLETMKLNAIEKDKNRAHEAELKVKMQKLKQLHEKALELAEEEIKTEKRRLKLQFDLENQKEARQFVRTETIKVMEQNVSVASPSQSARVVAGAAQGAVFGMVGGALGVAVGGLIGGAVGLVGRAFFG